LSDDRRLERQFKIRVDDGDLAEIDRMSREGVTLPRRKIPAGTNKSELTRMALGLDEPPASSGSPALERLTSRVMQDGGRKQKKRRQ
jgi:hypothetical protein